MTRPRLKRPLMTPRERHEDSHAVLRRRVERALEAGTPPAVTAREPDMPSRATLDRWLDGDSRLRARYVAALERQRMVLAEECVAEADRQAQHARGRHRITALRGQIAARTRLLRLIAAAEKKANAERDAANDNTPARGISDEGVAMLEKAFDDLMSNGSAPAADTSDDSASDDSDAGHGEETETPDDDEEEPSYAPEDARYRVAPDEDGEEEPLTARMAGNAPPPDNRPPDKEKSPWKPDTPFTVRFDVGGEPAPRGGGMADFDPFDW